MALEERSQTDTEEECTSCSVTGRQSTPDRQQRRHEQLDDLEEFVVVELVDEALQGAVPARRWTCSLPRVRFHTSNPAETVDIAMEESGLAACEPLTVGQLMQRTVVRVPHRVALRYKTRDTWKDVTYRDYYNQCIAAAKSFIKLGLQPFQAVLIVGFNSPEWHISALGSIFAGGLSCGLHETISQEECHQIARKVRAAVAVVENHSQMCRILIGKIQGKLPELKAIVQYSGSLVKDHLHVFDWGQFLELGADVKTKQIEDLMKEHTPNQCASLVYTVRRILSVFTFTSK
jgi:long-chain-fatty-acid--CoA ligase ACSBG